MSWTGKYTMTEEHVEENSFYQHKVWICRWIDILPALKNGEDVKAMSWLMLFLNNRIVAFKIL